MLSVAANDPLGGAGLTADLLTFAAHGVHPVSVLTAVTAQHFASVDRVEWLTPDLVAAQLDAVIDDVPVAAVKTGLLGTAATVAVVAQRVEAGWLPAPVVDPVLVDGRGARIVDDATVDAYRRLFAGARVVTPNLHEARLLSGAAADAPVESFAVALAALGADLVVVTGGALADDWADDAADDAVIGRDGRVVWLRSSRIATSNVRGSGCTFAAAIAAGIGLGRDPRDAIADAHRFVRTRLRRGAHWDLGGADGAGPVAHTSEGTPA